MKAEVVTMTPELASRLLERNTSNRHVARSRVDRHARAMREGRWIDEASAEVVVGKDGQLQNGQHRLWATVETGHEWECVLVLDAPPEARLFHDTGKPRSFSDYLTQSGVGDASNVAAICRLGWYWDAGALGSRLAYSEARRANAPDYADLWAWYTDHREEIAAAIHLALPLQRYSTVAKSVSALGAMLLTRIDPDDAASFYRQLSHREVPAPAVMLTIRALENREHNSGSGMRGDRQHQLALLLKGWNAWRNGDSPEVIKWRSGGRAPEAMPVPA